MIPKRIDRKPEVRDNFSDLGRYVAAAKDVGEKLDQFWIVNCDAGAGKDDLELALMEIEATRMAKPDIADKTYHLVVSFRDGDREKLSADDLKDIERNFAEALGYGDHQRVAGTHINTDHWHMHVAINKIHPVTGRCHTPRQDFKTLAKVAREMEQKYGLAIDKGMSNDTDKSPISSRARDYEAKTWQESFERHLVEHKPEIVALATGADGWETLHDGLADFGVELRKRGAGLVFAQTDGGKGRMKASALDRSCSLAALEGRLGPYVPPKVKEHPRPPKQPYKAKPLTRHPATNRLWRTYTQQKKPGFLARTFRPSNWKYLLMAEAYKDPMALVILLTYQELLHALDEATTFRRPSYRPPKAARPALKAWFDASAWKPPQAPWLKGRLDDMNLRAGEDGRTLYPFRDDKGHIWAVRAVDGQGQSSDVGDVSRPGLRHVIDPGAVLGAKGKTFSGPVVITSDALTAALVHQDTGAPVVVVPHDAGIEEIAADLRRRHPDNPTMVVSPGASPQAQLAAQKAGAEYRLVNTAAAQAKLIAEMVGRGQAVTVDHDQAKAMGAFVEDALSPAEARDSQPKRGSAAKGKARGKDGGGLGR